MKIISFNIGIKIDNSEAVAKYLKSADADIICLQEAVRPLSRNAFPIYRSEETIREFLEKDYPHYFFAPEWVLDKTYRDGKTRDFGGMVEQGKLILSKHPIVRGYDYFYFKTYELDRDRNGFYEGNDHGRAFQVCEIDANGTMIQVGNVHGLYSKDKMDTDRTLMQSNFIVEKLQLKQLPTILVGDFNVTPDTESIKILNRNYQNVNEIFNISSTRPGGKVIDFVFLSKDFTAASLVVDKTDISDHYPLILEIN